MISGPDLLKILEESGAILRGHFVLSSGRHSDTYFEKFRLLERPDVLSEVCARIAAEFRDRGVDAVAGPTTGGIIIAFEVARQLRVPALYIEREGEQRRLRRGAAVTRGHRLLVVDDVLTTGISVREVCELLRQHGAEIAGVATLVNRSEQPIDFGAPLFSAIEVTATSYAPNELPEWLAKIPVQDPGTRRLG